MLRKTRQKIREVIASATLLSIEMVALLVLYLASLFGFLLIAGRIFLLNEQELDHEAFHFFDSITTPANTRFMQVITLFASHYFLIPANLLLIAYFLFIKKHRWYSIKIPAIAISSTIMSFLLKWIFNRQRPLVPLLDEAGGLSFPSGHAFIGFTFYGLLIYIIWKSSWHKWLRFSLSAFLLLLVFIVGTSRIYLKVHYASDVIAGFCAGFIWLFTAVWLLGKMENYSRREVNPAVEQPNSQSGNNR